MFEEYNMEIYNKAYNLSKKYDSDTTKTKNPYEKDTKEFYSWNRGWNDYYNKEWDIK